MSDQDELKSLEQLVNTAQDDLGKANLESPPKDNSIEPAKEEKAKMGLFGKISLSTLLGGAVLLFGYIFRPACSYIYTTTFQPDADYSETSEYREHLEDRLSDIKDLQPAQFRFSHAPLDSTNSKDTDKDKNPEHSPFFSVTGIRGSSFYVKRSPDEFVERVKEWLEFLKADDLIPDPASITALEVGNILQQIGDTRLYGEASERVNTILFRPGDYSTFIHEVKHLGEEDNALCGEAGSFAVQVFTTGEYDLAQRALRSYDEDDRKLIRLLTEAVFVGGSEAFEWLKEYDKTYLNFRHEKTVDHVDLTAHLQRRIDEFKQRVVASGITPEQYLIGFHKLPKEVADSILEVTGDDLESVVLGTNGTKKKMISSFRALTSFYFINLGYPLPEAIDKTLTHFKKGEAMTLSETLWDGAKEIYARFTEYNVPFNLQRRFVENMLSHGTETAKKDAEELPKLFDFTANFGKNGWVLIDTMLSQPSFRNVLLYLAGEYRNDPSVVTSQVTWLLKDKQYLDTALSVCSSAPNYNIGECLRRAPHYEKIIPLEEISP